MVFKSKYNRELKERKNKILVHPVRFDTGDAERKCSMTVVTRLSYARGGFLERQFAYLFVVM